MRSDPPRHRLERIDSTNAEALRRAAAGIAPPFWIWADAQDAARGRRGRTWACVPGNLYASLALAPADDAPALALRSFVAALALADALEGAGVPGSEIALKWPNDVLAGGRKIAGILLETTRGPRGAALVVGFGVNLAAVPPPEALEPGAVPPAALGEFATPDSPAAFLDRLAPAFARWEARLDAEGFAPVRDAWLARAARLGEPIVARLPRGEHRGRFETVDDDGALVLDTGEGRIRLSAAEIHF